MASITFNYDPANPENVEVDIEISQKDELDSSRLIEILATGVNSVVVGCWDDNDEREQVALSVAKMLLIANDERKGGDDE